MRRLRLVPIAAIALGLLAAGASGASASDLNDPVHQWLPSPPSASWTWRWWDTRYVQQPVTETYTVAKSSGSAFELAWKEAAPESGSGTIDYERQDVGLVNMDWSGTAPPPSMPILCATAGQCGNSLAGAHFQLIWGTRSPVLLEPVVRNMSWSSTGGSGSDVASTNRYLGTRRVKVPAFPGGVRASGIESQVSQAGALGDPYGSGVRTVWWVYGVGPVRITFRHTGGPVTTAELQHTNLQPQPAPPDRNWFPVEPGSKATFAWRNSKWMRKASRQRFTVSQNTSGTARVDAKSLSGPIRMAGVYVFTRRLDGVTTVQAATRSASLAHFPALGPRRLPPSRRRHLVTPYDLMTYGFNPVLPAYPVKGQTWKSDRQSSDFKVFGVTGSSRVAGVRKVHVPAGTFRAVLVVSKLRQAGFPFGSGTRRSWFAPGRGLVKLAFRHADGSVSTVQRLR